MTSDLPAAATAAEAALRTRIRHLCDAHGVPVEQRARLVVSATTLARASHQPASVTGQVHTEPDGTAALIVILDLREPVDRSRPLNLPLPPEPGDEPSAVWRIPLPERQTGRFGHADEETAVEQELRAVLARADAIEREYRELEHELAETNNGVLAMYVQLQQQDEQLRRAHAVIFRELEDALRPPPPAVDGVELGVHYKPAGIDAPTGGDLYDWLVLPDGTLHISVVDAVGHGVTCTRNALNVTHTIRTLVLEGHALQRLVQRTARINTDLMATVLLARLNPATGRLQLANGSHPPALLVRDDRHTYLPVAGRGIGFPEPGSASVRSSQMVPGDLLLLYTDGLVESRGDVDEGELRLADAARRHAALPIEDVAPAIVHDMHDVVRYNDDTLLIAVRYVGPSSRRSGLVV